jgi:hypothetical protein
MEKKYIVRLTDEERETLRCVIKKLRNCPETKSVFVRLGKSGMIASA